MQYLAILFWLFFVICRQDNEPHDEIDDEEATWDSNDHNRVDENALEVHVDSKKRKEDCCWDCNTDKLQH